MYEKQTVDAFLHRIDCFVSDLLKDCRPSKSGDKVIHDPIWGSVVYHAWEIQLIDTVAAPSRDFPARHGEFDLPGCAPFPL